MLFRPDTAGSGSHGTPRERKALRGNPNIATLTGRLANIVGEKLGQTRSGAPISMQWHHISRRLAVAVTCPSGHQLAALFEHGAALICCDRLIAHNVRQRRLG